ncbi:unnamed protein product [marine sediment metagenome]|uniref:Uncharacterized protein n=1 Tax=marine sediment metagenome TaxID=412755 RepID=X1PNA9_9ZZZZ
MDASRGGLWVAKDVVSNIQYNAGGHCGYRKSYFAINIEFIEDLRQIVRKVDRARLRSRLQALGSKICASSNGFYQQGKGIGTKSTKRKLKG